MPFEKYYFICYNLIVEAIKPNLKDPEKQSELINFNKAIKSIEYILSEQANIINDTGQEYLTREMISRNSIPIKGAAQIVSSVIENEKNKLSSTDTLNFNLLCKILLQHLNRPGKEEDLLKLAILEQAGIKIPEKLY